jgi:hypothetical protein
LARGNAQEQTHSETSSNYLCTNDELWNWTGRKLEECHVDRRTKVLQRV